MKSFDYEYYIITHHECTRRAQQMYDAISTNNNLKSNGFTLGERPIKFPAFWCNPPN